jgi:hypothetical protein
MPYFVVLLSSNVMICSSLVDIILNSNQLVIIDIVGNILCHRRSWMKKHLRKISTEATPKVPTKKLRHSNTPPDEGLHRLKNKKTDRSIII